MMYHTGRRAKCHAGASPLERRVRPHLVALALALDEHVVPATSTIEALIDENLSGDERGRCEKDCDCGKEPRKAAWFGQANERPEEKRACEEACKSKGQTSLRTALPTELVLARRTARNPSTEECIVQEEEADSECN